MSVHRIIRVVVLFSVLALRASAVTIPVVDSQVVVQELRMKLDKLYTSQPYRSSHISAKVISLKTGETLYERNADKPLVPASTTKLFSTATLYTMRGAGAELVTDVRVDGKIDQAGTLHGDLYLVGCGDALLSITDIDILADQIERLGIKKITGTIYGDGSLFDGNVHRSRYSGDNEDVEPLPPITALSIQRGSLAIVVSASRTGSVSVQPIPASDGIELVSNVTASARRVRAATSSVRKSPTRRPRQQKTKPRRRGRSRASNDLTEESSIWDRVGDAPRRRPVASRGRRGRPGARISASSSINAQGIQRIVVSGRIAPGTSTTIYTSFAKPALATAGVLKQRLRTRGIAIMGGLGERQHPQSTASLTKVGRPLVEFASIVNKRSDNYLAEHVFKMCGAAAGIRPSSATASSMTVANALDSLQVPRSGCLFHDGSGLSRRNQVSATTQVALLRSISAQPWAQEFKTTLAVAGTDGTIRRRLTGTYAANNVHAKTGTLRNVSALAGYVTTLDGEPLAFSFISNGNSVSQYKYTEDMAALILATFSRSGTRVQNPSTLRQTSADSSSADVAEPGN